MEEAKVLRGIQRTLPSHESRIVKWIEDFSWQNHYCIVTEKLDISLHDFQKAIKFTPMNLHHVTVIMKDVFEALQYLNKLNIVHTDLKVENVLLEVLPPYKGDWRQSATSPRAHLDSFRVKLIDFGGATLLEGRRPYSTGIISTRQYRAPEVLLDLPWTFTADVWSAACILMELVTGKLLFDTHEELEHIAFIERIVGKFPSDIAKYASDIFDSRGLARFPRQGTRLRRTEAVEAALPVGELIRKFAPRIIEEPNSPRATYFLQWFTRMITVCLTIDPIRRADARTICKEIASLQAAQNLP